MGSIRMKRRFVEADVLCIGGGIAGLMAAIRAAEMGAKTVVAEKANTMFSGSGATGNDHFLCYLPEVHGKDIEPIVNEFQLGQQGGLRHRSFIHTWLLRSEEIVKLWDDWGIPMKYNGKYELSGHALPGNPIYHIHYAGKDQKKILTEQTLKRGAEIMNRVMCFDLITDGNGVTGAIGINTWHDEVVFFKAKTVILGTGSAIRLYPASTTPAWLFNTRLSPTCVGDGRAMAYRAGAELVNIEIPILRCGPVYFARAGKGTWAGVLRDPQGKPVGPFVTEPDNRYGDPVVDIYQDIFMDYKKTGRGPVYMDCKGLSDEGLEYMYHWLYNEGNAGLLNHLKEEGIDPRERPVEFRTYHYELFPRGGVYYDEEGATSMKGLYAAGDEFFGGISGAAVFGWIAGENAAKQAKGMALPAIDHAKDRLEEAVAEMEHIRNREVGASWKEANIALQQIMYDFTGEVRSETLLDAGLLALRRLKRKARESLLAANAHELCRCLEVFNLLEVGELIFIAAKERRETRGKHIRPDYPFTNPQLSKLLVLRKEDGGPAMEWRPIKR
ncbi:MAG: FAD-binding protein [Deltaproteobacteria bacterium]|nr:FAD-binding protein [Deltaproteobacteria bacterium]MBW2136722.1 FAD-binding protein [Deltaproteobacteria bacterium]